MLWLGKAHDSRVFESSPLKEILESGDNGCVLGDSGYPLKPYLLTPVLFLKSVAEQQYNNAHAKVRSVVERTLGIFKSRCVYNLHKMYM